MMKSDAPKKYRGEKKKMARCEQGETYIVQAITTLQR